MRKRKTVEDYHILAKKQGFKWLGPKVPNIKTKTTWQCNKGHKWQTSYTTIQQGGGCFICKRGFKIPAHYHALAQKQGFKWLGPEVSNATTKTTWQCSKGHQWQAVYKNIKKGSGCPTCSNLKRKEPQDYHTLAKKRGFKWLGPEVRNTQTKTTWQCEQGHQWQAGYTHIKQGSGCHVCSNYHSKIPTDYHALAKKRGFKWLGPQVPNISTRTAWQCKKGHQWQTPYKNVVRGNGCPVCANRLPKTPADYHALAKKRGFKWLGPQVAKTVIKSLWQCDKGHQWQTTYTALIQGQGCPVCANRLPKTATDYHDLAKKRGFKWLGKTVPKRTAIKSLWQCDKGHQWQINYNNVLKGHGCPVCSNSLPKTPQDYHALAKKRGFRWLGPKAANTGAKSTWQCDKGHQWQTTYDNIKYGYGCAVCSGRYPKTPKDYHALAKKQGFKWLGPEVPNTRTRTTWQCKKGHQWQSTYGNIWVGSNCPVCTKRRPKTPEEYHAVAEKHGFKWTGPAVPNTLTKTGWQCEQGHYWQTTYGSIRSGHGCRECYLETIRKRRKKKPKLIGS